MTTDVFYAYAAQKETQTEATREAPPAMAVGGLKTETHRIMLRIREGVVVRTGAPGGTEGIHGAPTFLTEESRELFLPRPLLPAWGWAAAVAPVRRMMVRVAPGAALPAAARPLAASCSCA